MTGSASSAALVCLFAAVVSAQPRQRSDALNLDRLKAWISAVAGHEPGRADPPVLEVGSWPMDESFETISDLVALVRGRRDADARLARSGRAPEVSFHGKRFSVTALDELLGLSGVPSVTVATNRLIKHALLLYTDIATFDPLTPRASVHRPGGESHQVPIIVTDGRGAVPPSLGADDRSIEWELARVLAAEVAPDAVDDVDITRWYRAVGAYLIDRREWGRARSHLERGIAVRPADSVLLFQLGVVHEFFAGPQAQVVRQTVTPPEGTKMSFESEDVELRSAEGLLRRALAADPSLTEARLHWGSVLSRLGHDADASHELASARAALTDPVLRYCADLFLGRAQAGAGEADRARESFERAATAFSRAQSPLFALSELARRSGDVSGALRALDRLLSLGEARRDNPWWTYDVSSARDAGAFMTAARKALAGGGA